MLKRFPRNPHWRYSGVFVDETRNEKDHFDVCPVLLQVIILQRMLVSEEVFIGGAFSDAENRPPGSGKAFIKEERKDGREMPFAPCPILGRIIKRPEIQSPRTLSILRRLCGQAVGEEDSDVLLVDAGVFIVP